MEITRTSVALLAVACLGAGAGGAYLANRGDAPAATEQQTSGVDTATAPVEQSEGVVTDPPPTAPTEPVAAAPAAAAPSRTAAAPAARRVTPSKPLPPRSEEPAPQRSENSRLSPPALEPVRPVEPEPVRTIEPPAPQFEELVVSADSVIGLQIDTALTSEKARVEDQVLARVTRDVRVGDRVAIPAGSRAEGEVTLVERGGKVRDRARLGVRFTSIVLADGTRVPVDTETLIREGDAPGGESAAKIGGGAIGGAILGGILGGAKGAVLGGTAGAGAGTAAVMVGGRNAATLPAGTPVTVRITKPATVTVDK
jgi:hypothetical protein